MAWAQVQMGFQPWIPESLCGIVDGSTLKRQSSYVVVEEMLLEEARTVVSTWPMLAPDGQLRFGDPEDADEYIDPLEDIVQLLRERRLVPVDGWAPESVDALMARPVEVGDVFAVLSPLGSGSGPGGDGPGGGGGGGGSARLTIALHAVPLAEIYDITADARSAATATYSSATAGALTEEDAERFFDDGEDETQGEGGTPSPAPTGGGQGSGGGAASKQDESLVSAVAKEVVVEAGRRSASAAAPLRNR